jgi:hypothetical protein
MNCHAQYREALLDNNNKSNTTNNNNNNNTNNTNNTNNNNNTNSNNNNNIICLQSVETSDESSASSSTYDASSSVSSSWTDSDDDSSSSNSNSSFDYTQLEFDLSRVLSASKRLTGGHVPTYSASELFDEKGSSPTMRKSASHHNFLGHTANKSSSNEPSAADLLLAEDDPTHLMRKCKSFANLSSDRLRGLDTDDEGTMASIREDLLTLAGTLLASRKGDAFRERALVLASINYLARNVPCCVLDHLGREVRQADHRSLFPDQPSTPTTMANSCDSSSSASMSSSCPTDGGWNLMDDDDSRFTGYRTLTRIQSLDAQTKGVILDLPFVAPFQGVVLFGKPLDGAINDHRIIMACPHLYTIIQLTSSVLRNCRPDLARK